MAIRRDSPYSSVLGSIDMGVDREPNKQPSVDTHSEAWKKLKTIMDQAIDNARRELEVEGISMDQTQYLRGKIAAYRHMLSIGSI